MPGLSRHVLEQAHTVVTPGQGAMAWQRVGNVALALGDPLAPLDSAPEVLRRFLYHVKGLGLHPVLAPITDGFRRTCVGAGLRTQSLGREATVDLTRFHLEGNAKKRLRQSYERGLREGVRFHFLRPPLTQEQLEELGRVSEAWLQGRPLGELKIGLGWFDPTRIRQSPLGVAQDKSGRIVSFVTLHGYDSAALGLDLLRRHPEAPPGAVEVLLVELFRHLSREGHSQASLGLAPLTAPKLPARVVRWVGKRMLRYDCQGLEQFKKKFRPQWSERHVAYASRRGLVEILATGIAS